MANKTKPSPRQTPGHPKSKATSVVDAPPTTRSTRPKPGRSNMSKTTDDLC